MVMPLGSRPSGIAVTFSQSNWNSSEMATVKADSKDQLCLEMGAKLQSSWLAFDWTARQDFADEHTRSRGMNKWCEWFIRVVSVRFQRFKGGVIAATGSLQSLDQSAPRSLSWAPPSQPALNQDLISNVLCVMSKQRLNAHPASGLMKRIRPGPLASPKIRNGMHTSSGSASFKSRFLYSSTVEKGFMYLTKKSYMHGPVQVGLTHGFSYQYLLCTITCHYSVAVQYLIPIDLTSV